MGAGQADLDQFLERKQREERGREFFASLDREVYQMRYQRLLLSKGLEQDARLPKVNPFANVDLSSPTLLIRDDTGKIFADHTRPKIDKPKSAKIPSTYVPQENKSVSNGITVDNFYVQTKGVFYKIDKVPDGYHSIFKSKGSEYFTNEAKTHVVRASDHWGYWIKDCDWFLRMHPSEKAKRIGSFAWSRKYKKEKFIGIICLKDLSHNDHSKRPQLRKKVLT